MAAEGERADLYPVHANLSLVSVLCADSALHLDPLCAAEQPDILRGRRDLIHPGQPALFTGC